MKINCDLGERGVEHDDDCALIKYIDVANIACGGHAGDADSAQFYCKLAGRYGVEVTAHLSYADKENFGRVSMDLSASDLQDSLSEQRNNIGPVQAVKFHGALYHDSCYKPDVAKVLVEWMQAQRILSVITMPSSFLAVFCEQAGIEVVREAFVERRYTLDHQSLLMTLVDRDKPYACLTSLQAAMQQVKRIVETCTVDVIVEEEGGAREVMVPLFADTLCVHSDSPISLDLVKALFEYLSD